MLSSGRHTSGNHNNKDFLARSHPFVMHIDVPDQVDSFAIRSLYMGYDHPTSSLYADKLEMAHILLLLWTALSKLPSLRSLNAEQKAAQHTKRQQF